MEKYEKAQREICDRKYMFAVWWRVLALCKQHLVHARMIKTCPKKVNKKKNIFLYIQQGPSFNEILFSQFREDKQMFFCGRTTTVRVLPP